MLDQLLNLVRQNSETAVIQNPAIPNEKNEAAVETAGNSIMATLKDALSNGKINDVLGYFKGGGSGSHGIINEATGNYAQELQNNLGLDQAQAQSVADNVIPQSMNDLALQTADPGNNNFDIQNIFNQLSGGKSGNLDVQGLLKKFGGGKLDNDGDGDVDVEDIKSMFSGGSGGIMDKVKGLFQ